MLGRVVKVGIAAVVLVVVAALGAYALVVGVTGRPPTWAETTRVCDQPATVDYVDGTYGVHLRTTRLALTLDEAPPEALVGRSDSHGVIVVLAEGTGAEDVTCRWDDDAVEVVDRFGIAHRVPASVFTGGR